MEECKCGRIPPCYGSLEFAIYEEAKKVNDEWKKSRARHGKLIDKLRGKLMEGGFLDDTHDKVYELNKQMCDLGKTILTKNKDIMEEKKTNKMTKAEAFEYLKGTKVVLRTEDDQLNLQKKLFDIGYKWLSSDTTLLKMYDVSCVFFLGIDGFIQHEEYEDEANKLFCDTHIYKPIKLRDILSIEVVEEKHEL